MRFQGRYLWLLCGIALLGGTSAVMLGKRYLASQARQQRYARAEVLPGAQYQSQKAVFTDPVSGRTVWRMTVDGTRFGAWNVTRDASGMEANSFSPDGRRICYSKWQHRAKPDGYYVMDLQSGVETYVAPSGQPWGTCEFSKTSNELYVMFVSRSAARETSWAELRAVDLETHDSRTLRRFPEAISALGLAFNADGSYLAVFVAVGDPRSSYEGDAIHFAVLDAAGNYHPNWSYDPGAADAMGAGDHPYWSPVDPKVLRAARRGETALWNIDTLERVQLAGGAPVPPSHACWSADGVAFHAAFGHPACHPHDTDGSGGTLVAVDSDESSTPYIFLLDSRELDHAKAGSVGPEHILAIHYSSSESNFGHPHPQFSPRGDYLLFQSDVTEAVAGTPPGGVDSDPRTVDLFVVPLEP
jgi:Tol biopolymer transport system component